MNELKRMDEKKKLYLGVEKSSRGQEPSTNRGHLR